MTIVYRSFGIKKNRAEKVLLLATIHPETEFILIWFAMSQNHLLKP